MSTDRPPDKAVGLLFRLTLELPETAGLDSPAPGRPEFRLEWVICAGGTPLLTLDCRLAAKARRDGR